MEQQVDHRINTRIREAETSRARTWNPQGRDEQIVNNNCESGKFNQFLPSQFMHTALMDEDYLIVAAHVDESLERCIRSGEYVDFARLIPQDRVQMQQDNRLQLIQQDGHISCTPVSGSNNSDFSINSFACWEQAFRVFSNVYMRQFPQRASELIQYNHVIHTASMIYAWNNVYAYDIDF